MSETTAGTSKLAIRWLDVLVTVGIAAAVVLVMVQPQARRTLTTPKGEQKRV